MGTHEAERGELDQTIQGLPCVALGLEAQAGFQPSLSCHISLMPPEEEQAIWGWGWGGHRAESPRGCWADGNVTSRDGQRWSAAP